MEAGVQRTDAPEVPHHKLIATCNATQQATPRELHSHISGNSLQLLGQVLNRGLDKESVRQAALGRPAVNFFGNLFEWSTIRVKPNEECLRVFLRALVDKETISGSDVYIYAAIVRGY